MLPELFIPLRADVPDWLALSVVIASVALAIVTLSLMLLRLRPAPDQETGNAPATVRDPVLFLSAIGVILLAVAAWWLR
jgi:hypothetical protein